MMLHASSPVAQSRMHTAVQNGPTLGIAGLLSVRMVMDYLRCDTQ